MTSRISLAIVAGFGLVAAAIAVQPVLAQQQTAVGQDLRYEITLLKERVTRLEENAKARLQPAS